MSVDRNNTTLVLLELSRQFSQLAVDLEVTLSGDSSYRLPQGK